MPIGTPVLTATVISSTQINLALAYSGPPGAISFAFEVAPALNGPFVPLSSGSSSTYPYTGLSQATTYYFRGRVQVNDGRFSAYSNTATATTLAGVPAQPTNLVTGSVTTTTINLSWSAALNATSYNIYRDGSVVGSSSSTTFQDSGLSPGTVHQYQVSGVNSAGEGPLSNTATGTTSTPTNTGHQMVFTPGVHAIVGNIGGQYSSVTSAMSDWQPPMTAVATKNTSKIIKGFCVVLNWPLLMQSTGTVTKGGPTALSQGLISVANGVSFLTQLYNFIKTLPNGPYTLSIEVNSVGNTLNSAGAGSATVNAPAWWIDNTTYGPVTAASGATGQHGGLWYGNTTGASGLFLRIDNANVLNEMRYCLVNLQNQLDASGIHLESINPFQELSLGGVSAVQCGISNASFIAAMGGTTGIPNGFAADLRGGIPNSLLQIMPTFANGSGNPGGHDATAQLVGIFCRNFWSIAPFDGSNLTNPSDYAAAGKQAKTKADWGQQAFCGQSATNGPIVYTNYKALGYNSHHHTVADELGGSFILGYDAVVPPAGEGNGRLPDILSGASYTGASHFFVWMQNFTGPNCNCYAPNAGAPANYPYPLNGPTVPYQNIVDSLAGFNANSYLNLNYPTAFP